MPTVFIADEIPALDGQKVTVHGTYTQVDVRQRAPRDTRPPQLDGHVALVLADGRRIYLEPSWSAVALRPAEERARLDGKAVEVVGLLHATMPEPEIPVARLTAPCILAVESMRLKQ